MVKLFESYLLAWNFFGGGVWALKFAFSARRAHLPARWPTLEF